MFAGQMGCEALNFALKRIIREERPKRRWAVVTLGMHMLTKVGNPEMFGKGYGMPSSHAQFVAFFAIYLSLFLLLRHTPDVGNSQAYGLVIRAILGLGLCLGAGAVATSRVYLNYHTPKQVLAGCAAGVVCAASWFFVTWFLRTTGWIDWALDLGLVRHLRARDLVVREDLAEAGWQRWEAKRKLRRRGHPDGAPCKSD